MTGPAFAWLSGFELVSGPGPWRSGFLALFRFELKGSNVRAEAFGLLLFVKLFFPTHPPGPRRQAEVARIWGWG